MLVFLRPHAGTGPESGDAQARSAQSVVASLATGLGSTVLAMTTVPATLTVSLTGSQAAALSESPSSPRCSPTR